MQDDERPTTDDDPVHDYYAEKKRRYLKALREDRPAMSTGTPHDWEDAAGYEAPHDAED